MSFKVKFNSLSGRISQTALVALFVSMSGGIAFYALRAPTPAQTQQLGDVGEEPLRPTSCQVASSLSDFRNVLHQGSPAARKYQREITMQNAAAGSFEELQALVAQEQDPQVLEVLAQAVVRRSQVLKGTGDPIELRPLLDRIAIEPNVTLRVALLRPLGETSEPGGEFYGKLIQDPAPEVRQVVVANIIAGEKISYGHISAMAGGAISVAVAAQTIDPEAGARILENVEIRTAGAPAIDAVINLLQANNARLRRGAATALGTVGVVHSQRVTEALVIRYQSEADREVRKSILQALVRVGFARAIPTLEALRSIDRSLNREIDLWLTALQPNRQEWKPLLWEKQKLEQS